MIDPLVLAAFSDELLKVSSAPAGAAAAAEGAAKMSGKMKALLGLTAAGGVGLGAVGEQAKDDIVAGRQMRISQARAQGLSPYLT